MKMVNFEKKKMIPLRNEQQESYEKTKICCIWKKKFKHKYTNDRNYQKVKDHCHYTGKYRDPAYSMCDLKDVYLKKFLWFFTIDRIII